MGDCSSADVKRLSITVSNGNMFFDSDPVETQTEIHLRFATGDVRMTLSSGRFSSSSVPAEVRTYIESNAGNSIPVEIIR